MCKRKIELSQDHERDFFNFVLTTSDLSGDWENYDEWYYYELNYHPIGYKYVVQLCLIEGEELSDVDFSGINDMLRDEWYAD